VSSHDHIRLSFHHPLSKILCASVRPTAFMAALQFGYARLVSTEEYLAGVTAK